MIQRIVDELGGDNRWRTAHLPFYFTPSFQSVRRFRIGKVVELFAVWFRFIRLVAYHGRPDVVLYPSGGPQTVPVIRDILLLPIMCLFSKRVHVQFHAAGIADRLRVENGLIEKLLKLAYRNVAGAIVMTEFNRCDPEALGIKKIAIIPHRLPDENPGGKVESGKWEVKGNPELNQQSAISNQLSPFTLLYAGHLYDLKGTPQLIEAFGAIAAEFPWAKLVLMGEFLPPYTEEACRKRCLELGIADRVEITGVLQGKKKAAQFRAAHLFVFPSIAPYESFGLVMAEAMMWGLPIVATDWRGNRDVTNGEAVLFPVSKAETLPGLRLVLVDTLNDIPALVRLAKQSRERFERCFKQESGQSDYRNVVARILNL